MFKHTRYQAFCVICSERFEADSIEEAIAKAIKHEQVKDQGVRRGTVDPKTHKDLKEK